MTDATFDAPGLPTFARLGELGLVADGRRPESDRAVLACRVAASTSAERKLLAGQKAKLEAEQVKLRHAHYADTTPIDLLKTEDRTRRASDTQPGPVRPHHH